MQPQSVDPSENRDEFQRRLESSNCWKEHFTDLEVIDALIDADAEKLQKIRDMKAACAAHVKKYMDQYDAAKDKEAKQAVVGSVVKYKPA